MKFIDAHAHIASWPMLEVTVDNLLSSMKEHNIQYSLISNSDAAEFPSLGDEAPLGKSSIECFEEVLKFVHRHPRRFGGLLWIRPHEETLSEEFKAYVKAHRSEIYGLKFHPYTSHIRINDPKMDPWYRFAAEENLPILVHTAMDVYSSIRYLGEIAPKYPKTIFIAGHLELCSDHELAIELLAPHKNVYGDTCWVSMDVARKALDAFGNERLLFGTDNPIDGGATLENPMYQDYFENKENLSNIRYGKLMRHNAVNLFHLPLKS